MKMGSIQRTYLFPFILLLLLAVIVSVLLPRYRVEGQKKSKVSWYGGKFHGRLAASGRSYNMLDFTAAHCTRPMESRLRITNLTNNRSVIVQVADRGPYKVKRSGRVVRPLTPHPSREVDLSYWAARRLGIIRRGVVEARIEYLAN